MATPSCVLVPRPNSSMMTRDRGVARRRISEASCSSTMNVLACLQRLSDAPILLHDKRQTRTEQPSEDCINDSESCACGRNIGANLSHDSNEGNLADVAGLAACTVRRCSHLHKPMLGPVIIMQRSPLPCSMSMEAQHEIRPAAAPRSQQTVGQHAAPQQLDDGHHRSRCMDWHLRHELTRCTDHTNRGSDDNTHCFWPRLQGNTSSQGSPSAAPFVFRVTWK